MIDKHNVITKLNDALAECDLLQHKLDTANKRIAELESAQRWIPVSERLPDEAKWVLVYSYDYYGKAYYNNGAALWFDVLHTRLPDVTHWMPLPPPPDTP